MSFNGSGVFVRLYNWVNDAASSIKIRADRMDNEMDGLATGLSACITKDGQTTVTGNLPMATYRHTGVGDGTSRNNYSSVGQTQDGKLNWVDGGGTADAITASYAIPITALVDGQICYVRATAANATTTPTFAPSGLTARTIVKEGGQALVAGNISADGHELILRYDLSNTRWELLNPKAVTTSLVTLTGTQELTNKTLLDSTTFIADNADNTKKMAFQASGITAGATRTLTMPDHDVALADLYSAVNNFRLTLTTAVPVTTSDVTGATTIYLTPYKGNKIALYDGTKWDIISSAEVSVALGTITSDLVYDVFCYNNAGTPALEILAWTNNTTRATALVYQDGVLSKTGELTRRYLGTFCTTSTTTTEDSLAKRFLWNYYNKGNRSMIATDSTTSWAYSTASFRQARATTTNQLNFVVGVSEDRIRASVYSPVVFSSTATARYVQVGIGLDSTTVNSAQVGGFAQCSNSNGNAPSAAYSGLPAVGKHYLAWLEFGNGTDTQTWYTAFNTVNIDAGIIGEIMA